MSNLRSSQDGFTIIELLIATTVFSLVMLGALAGFLEIGKLFYKGVSTTNTQAAANQILQDVSGQFQTNGTFTSSQSNFQQVMPEPGQQNDQEGDYAYYCIGNTRYTYNINHELDISNDSNYSSPAQGGNFGLLKDILPGGGSSCAEPCTTACGDGAYPFTNPQELLGGNMRLSEFQIEPAGTGSNFFNVTIVLAYGDDDAFGTSTNDPSTIACTSDSGLDQFCSVSRLSTSLYKGFNL